MENPLVYPVNATGLPLHPYFPLSVALPSYVANSLSTISLLAIFGAGCVVIFGITHLFIQSTRPTLSSGESLATFWFVLCGCIHLFFEGYFSLNFADMAGRTDIFGQLWKEYSLSDSRYLTQDPFVVCMETVTAFLWGPLSFLCAYSIVKDLPMRHPLQIIISLGQLYGDILYYATCSFNEIIYQVVYCRPESIYFWAYYFLCNFFWIVIPAGLIFSSIGKISSAFSELKAIKATKKGM